MVDLLKKFFCAAAVLSAAVLLGAVDSNRSYFTVSNHQPGVNVPVKVTVFIRDNTGKAADAAKITLSCDKPAKISAVKKIASGKFEADITFDKAGVPAHLTVTADGVKVLENFIQNPDDLRFCTAWTSNLYSNEMRRFADRLETVSLDRKNNAAWGFCLLEGANCLHDRKYRISAEVELFNLVGHGVVLVGGERNKAGKEQQGPHYGQFRAGDKQTIRLEKLIQPRPWGVNLSFGCSVMTADGKVIIRYPRAESVPTFVTQATAGRKIQPKKFTGYDRFAKSYSKAAAAGFEKLLAMPENKDLKAKIAGNISAYTALDVRQELAKRAKLIESKGADALRKQLREAAFKVEVKPPFGKNINAIIMRKMDKAPVLDGNLNEWSSFTNNFKNSRGAHEAAVPQTDVAAGYDKDNLYLAFRLNGKVGRAGNAVPHDGDEIWRSDSVEIFIVPEHGNGFYQLAVGANGQTYDGAEGDGMVNFPWKKAYKVNDSGWVVEMAIPWKSVGFTSVPKEFRGNFCRTVTFGQASCWSIHSRGYSEAAGMGFVVADSFGKAKDAASFIALKNADAVAKQRAEIAASEKARKELSGNGVIFSLWDDETDFEKDPNYQVRFLSERMKKNCKTVLSFKQAINEFAHKSFIVSAIAGAKDMKFVLSDLVSADGRKIPAANLSVWKIGYLEPSKALWKSRYDSWSKRPIPELVEEVDGALALEEFQSVQFRLVIDSHKVAAGKYSGKIAVNCGGKNYDLPVNCEVMDFALPDAANNPYRVYLFSSLPYGGKSGEAWAKMYQERYVNEISFEHPRMFLDGKEFKSPGWRSENYIKAITEWKQPANSKFTIDGKLYDFDDRIAICGRWGLIPQLTNRTGSVYVDLMDELDAHFKALGVKEWDYKLGDEDHSPWYVPLAKAIRRQVPTLNVSFIPAGYEYWDLKSIIGAFTNMTYSRAAMTINAQGEKDLKTLRANGIKISRYTNRTSWAERSGRFAGRVDIWEVLIREGLDGFCVWTASPYVTLDCALGYDSAYKVPAHNFPPENQSTCQLVYIRKQGDFYKPVSCIRMEDMRDGITDALYYREALKRTENDPEMRKKLLAIGELRCKTRKDYDNARMKIAEIILALK